MFVLFYGGIDEVNALQPNNLLFYHAGGSDAPYFEFKYIEFIALLGLARRVSMPKFICIKKFFSMNTPRLSSA